MAAYRRYDWDEAERLCRAALDVSADDFDALHLYGIIAAQRRRLPEAVELLTRAVSANPASADARNNLGNVLRDLDLDAEALEQYDQALALNPDYAAACNNRGTVLHKLGRHADALESCARALSLRPDYGGAYFNRGLVLHDLRRNDEAVEDFGRALALDPRHAGVHHALGNALRDLKRYAEALECHDRATALDPDSADVWKDRGDVLCDLGRYANALASYDRALRIRPDFEFLYGLRLYTAMKICEWNGLDDHLARLVAKVESREKACPPFILLAMPGSPATQRTAAEIYVQPISPPSHALPAIPGRAAHDRIRVGYLSANFHEHAMMRLMAEVFEMHDRSRFELTAFSFGPDRDDATRQRVSAAFDRFIDVRARSDEDVALLARSLEIDVAVDLMGYTKDSRPAVFALRAAPVQVNYLGFPGTMGAGFIDYLIADRTVIPEAHWRHYAEKIAYLPDSYLPSDTKCRISDRPFTREELGLPQTGFVFCCFNNTHKITPAVFDIWMRVLGQVDGSVLWLLEDNPEAAIHLREEAGRRGIGPRRVVFAPRVPPAEHLARHRLADLFLDTLPYNAHTTASDALWTGLPLLTHPGGTFAGRVGASLLGAIGLPELIADTPQHYERLAVELGTDRDRLREIRRRLEENRLTAPLFDTRRFTGHIEAAFAAMHDRHRAGLAPDHIDVHP